MQFLNIAILPVIDLSSIPYLRLVSRDSFPVRRQLLHIGRTSGLTLAPAAQFDKDACEVNEEGVEGEEDNSAEEEVCVVERDRHVDQGVQGVLGGATVGTDLSWHVVEHLGVAKGPVSESEKWNWCIFESLNGLVVQFGVQGWWLVSEIGDLEFFDDVEIE